MANHRISSLAVPAPWAGPKHSIAVRSRILAGSLLLAAALPLTCAAQIQTNLSPEARSSSRPVCEYRNGFHVPEPLRTAGEPFRWGALDASTPVKLKVVKKASSRGDAGGRVELEVAEDVLVNGFAVIREGAEAWGTLTESKRPGLGGKWIVYDDDPDLPEPMFGHKGEFPILTFNGGYLSVQIAGAYDITGGAVPLHGKVEIHGEAVDPASADRAAALAVGAVISGEVLRLGLEKLSHKRIHSLAGNHATLREGAEVEAFVEDAVCYDVDFLARVRQINVIEARDKGAVVSPLPALAEAQAAPVFQPASRDAAVAQHSKRPLTGIENLLAQNDTPKPVPPNLAIAPPDSTANLASAVRSFLAFNRLRNAAEQGDAEAQYELGAMYHAGDGIPKDDVEAAYWLQKAAGHGMVKAQGTLAMIDRSGVAPTPAAERSRRKAQ